MFIDTKTMHKNLIWLSAVIFIISLNTCEGSLKRCFQCRSRGELGSCKDPFKVNVTQLANEPGIEAIPCASGWCGKVIERQGSFRTDDYDMATQRMCVQRGPSDSEDRCAETVYNYKKVYMCFCKGDLCNSANGIAAQYSTQSFLTALVLIAVQQFVHRH